MVPGHGTSLAESHHEHDAGAVQNSSATHPWLHRPQSVSNRNLFVIHSRDNLVPGAAGPKNWTDVTAEFNEHFKDVLKKPLAWKTLQKRYGVERKIFLKENPEYPDPPRYPVNLVGDNETRGAKAQSIPPMLQPGQGHEGATAIMATLPSAHPMQLPPSTGGEQLAEALPHERQITQGNGTLKLPQVHPGWHNPDDISSYQISSVDRAKYHLRNRTNDVVTFHVIDKHEADVSDHEPQFVDYDVLIAISPAYARSARANPKDTSVYIPSNISSRTINVFIQIISPVCANTLPTHYLWKSVKPASGVYDRFGAVKAEKIEWALDVLLELILLAREMEVWWICDMVVDRLHWMYQEQTKFQVICAAMTVSANGYVQIEGKQVYIGSRLPPIPALHFNLSTDNFNNLAVAQMLTGSADMPTALFLADLARALKGRMNPDPLDVPRNGFCARYHHHKSSSPCYAALPQQPYHYYINRLYSVPSHDELVALSNGLPAVSSLDSILYSHHGVISKLRRDNSSPEMIAAEKQIMEMEMRLEQAKAVLRRARTVGEEEKSDAIKEAKKVVEGMYERSRVARL
jgi:hypothetical protein